MIQPEYTAHEETLLREIASLTAQLAKSREATVEECLLAGSAAVERCEPDPNILVRAGFDHGANTVLEAIRALSTGERQ